MATLKSYFGLSTSRPRLSIKQNKMFLFFGIIVSLEAKPALTAFFLQTGIWESLATSGPITMAVIGFLLAASVLSWSIVFSKWSRLRKARTAN